MTVLRAVTLTGSADRGALSLVETEVGLQCLQVTTVSLKHRASAEGGGTPFRHVQAEKKQ